MVKAVQARIEVPRSIESASKNALLALPLLVFGLLAAGGLLPEWGRLVLFGSEAVWRVGVGLITSLAALSAGARLVSALRRTAVIVLAEGKVWVRERPWQRPILVQVTSIRGAQMLVARPPLRAEVIQLDTGGGVVEVAGLARAPAENLIALLRA